MVRGGRRDRIVVYGAPADDGTRLMRKYDTFDGPTFVKYPKEARPKWGRVPTITGNASQHRHRGVKKYLEGNDGVGVPYLPTATSKPSAVENVWKDAKYGPVTSEFYETLEY